MYELYTLGRLTLDDGVSVNDSKMIDLSYAYVYGVPTPYTFETIFDKLDFPALPAANKAFPI